MCGITGLFSFNEIGRINQMYLVNATRALTKRGPDFEDFFEDYYVGLGHRRLSIIDTSSKGNQPMQDESERYVIVFNGEIYNYRELRKELTSKGYTFNSESETEVLLKLYIDQREACLSKLNGLFAFAIYDKEDKSLFLARDRMGIKPLLFSMDEDRFIFGSEMKAMLAYGLKKDLNYDALLTYLELNYIPHPQTIFRDVQKCPPGHYMIVSNGELTTSPFYEISRNGLEDKNYEQSSKQFVELLDQSVQRRLIADVPVGAFLSGGIDSSCIVALASRHVDQLNTYSIGYRDEPYFDETHYANEVAKHLGANHKVFSLTNYDLLKHLDDVVNYIDEPFADSSAIPVYIISKEAKQHITVALSGDGADEIFSGYNKHYALNRSLKRGLRNSVISRLLPLWKILPKSRSGKIGNLVRQLERFAQGRSLSPRERYWFWAPFNSKSNALKFLSQDSLSNINHLQYEEHKELFLQDLDSKSDLNDFLRVDTKLVLPNDMLTKVDLMSMANSLEVRVPLLDHEIVDFAFSLPVDYKVNGNLRKRIVRDAFKDILPTNLYKRPKKGFEVPLVKWFRNELKGELDNHLFNQSLIENQGIFDWQSVKGLRDQIHSSNTGDSHAKIWALYVFQRWWKNNMS